MDANTTPRTESRAASTDKFLFVRRARLAVGKARWPMAARMLYLCAADVTHPHDDYGWWVPDRFDDHGRVQLVSVRRFCRFVGMSPGSGLRYWAWLEREGWVKRVDGGVVVNLDGGEYRGHTEYGRAQVSAQARSGERARARSGERAGRAQVRAQARSDEGASALRRARSEANSNKAITTAPEAASPVVVVVDSSIDERDAKAAMPKYVHSTARKQLAMAACQFASHSGEVTGYAVVKFVEAQVATAPEAKRAGIFVSTLRDLEGRVDIDEVVEWVAKKKATPAKAEVAAVVEVKPLDEMSVAELMHLALKYPTDSPAHRLYARRAKEAQARQAVKHGQ